MMSEDTPTATTPIPNEEPKKKRAKIMSACGECRRKKTKCDGEQPCYNCNKSKSKCMYSLHNNSMLNDKRTVNSASKATLEAIEMRLKVIEDLLRTILEHSSSTTSFENNTLPSIATLPTIHHHANVSSPSSPIIKHQRLPSPLSLVNKTEFDIFQYHQQQQRQQNNEQPIKKRKR